MRTPRLIYVLAIAFLLPLLVAAGEHGTKRKVRVTHYGFPGDPSATRLTRLGLGDHNNILNEDSVAVTRDLNSIFPFGSRVMVNGQFLGIRHDTTASKAQNMIAVYDPDGKWKEDFDAVIDVPAKRQ